MALPKKKIADKTSKLSKELPPIEEGFEFIENQAQLRLTLNKVPSLLRTQIYKNA